MGSAVSAFDEAPLIIAEIQYQKQKPIDASDITSLYDAQQEIIKLRNFFHMIDIDSLTISTGATGDQTANNLESTDVPLSTKLFTPAQSQRGNAIVSSIQTKLNERYTSLHESFLQIDIDRSGYISKQEFQQVIIAFLIFNNKINNKTLHIGLCIVGNSFG